MLTVVQDFLLTLLPAKRKKTAKGWISFSGACCVHNGESQDKRGRAGVIPNTDGGLSYSCFNCNFRATYRPGQPLSFKFRKLLKWMGASDEEIRRLVIEAIRLKDMISPDIIKEIEETAEISYKPIPLPKGATSLWKIKDSDVTKDVADQLDYLMSRKVDLQKYEFFTTKSKEYQMNRRVIIPLTWKNEIIGYSGRFIDDVPNVKVKYFTEHDPDYVFNVDKQLPDSKFVIVSEGCFDAMAVDGVAVLGDHASEKQIDIIDSLGREVIAVPDFDAKGKKWTGAKLIDTALEAGWSVSYPVWSETCKDISEAVRKYGKLFTILSILRAKEHSRLKIELMKKRIAH